MIQPDSDNPIANEKDLIRLEQLKLLYKPTYLVSVSYLVIAIFLVMTLWQSASHSLLLGWLAALVLVVLFRTASFIAFKRIAPDWSQRATWEYQFLIGSTVAGLVWGSSGLLLYPQDDSYRQIVLILFIVGVAAGSTTTLSPRREVSIPFLIMLLGPLIYTIWGEQYDIVELMLAGLIYCLLFLIASSLNNYSTHKMNIRLRIESVAREEVLRRSEQALQVSEEKFRTMTEDGSDIVATIDGGGKISFISRSAERILGYKSEELLGHSWFEFIEPDDHERFRDALNRIFSHAGESVPVELAVNDHSGVVHRFEVRGRTAPGHNEVIMNARDISENRALED